MTEKEHSAAWAETALRYLDALDAGDVALLAELWERASAEPQLEQVLGELTDGLAVEEERDPAWEADAEKVRSLLREHLPSAFPIETKPAQLTVGNVAARLEVDSVLGARLSAADKAANGRLRLDATPVPEDLGLPHFEKWKTSLGIGASAHYWRAFRQTAVLLLMGRCQQAGELAAARRAGLSPKGGRS
ncbi:MAG TPA: hypothetical protein VMF69_08360 [Gemmataceae bacterium]|nr:hypothetical protein [Gemmataceae bacterium]